MYYIKADFVPDESELNMEQYRRGHNEHDWKSCDGQKPSKGSNPFCSATEVFKILVLKTSFYIQPQEISNY